VKLQDAASARRVEHDRLVGTGLTRLVNELEKLAAYADGGVINSATVQGVRSP
jgi:hypothetical protein